MSVFTHREALALRTPEAVEDYVRRHLRWNMGAGIVDAMCFALAQQIMSNETVIPLLITRLGASTVLLGAITALTNLGVLLPQLFMARVTEELPFKKPISLLSGAFERASFFLIGLAVWAWGASAPHLALLAFVVLRALGSVSLGMIIPAWSTMIGKVIPTRKRGQFFGIGRGLGALLGVGGGLLAGYLLQTQPYPRGFALCLMLGSGVLFVSWAGLAVTREPPDLVVRSRPPVREYFSQLPVLMRRDANFSRFIVARIITVLGTMAVTFMIVYGSRRFQLSGADVGGLTATIATVQAVMYLVWGAIADRHGYKRVLSLAAVAMACAAVVVLITPHVAGLYVALGLVGAALSGEFLSGSNILLEFGPPSERPTYIGLASTLLAPFRALAPVLGGALASGAGYSGLFAAAAAVSVAGAVFMTFRVVEPRTLEDKAERAVTPA